MKGEKEKNIVSSRISKKKAKEKKQRRKRYLHYLQDFSEITKK